MINKLSRPFSFHQKSKRYPKSTRVWIILTTTVHHTCHFLPNFGARAIESRRNLAVVAVPSLRFKSEVGESQVSRIWTSADNVFLYNDYVPTYELELCKGLCLGSLPPWVLNRNFKIINFKLNLAGIPIQRKHQWRIASDVWPLPEGPSGPAICFFSNTA